MEFIRTNKYSHFIESGFPLLLEELELSDMLKNEFLHDLHSHFIVTKDGNYEDSRFLHFGLVPERMDQLVKAYRDGHTLVIKDLENWNFKIQSRCKEFSHSTNVHLYLSPPNGTGFGWHTDDRDVYIFMQRGCKTFEVEEPDNSIKQYELAEGSRLYIPYGAKHRAIANSRASLHLGFGVWPQDITIQQQYKNFPIDLEIEL